MISTALILLTIGISIVAFPAGVQTISSLHKPELFYKLSFRPYDIFRKKEYYRFITYGFIHLNWMHLIFNMLTLYFFAPNIEFLYTKIWGKALGSLYLLAFYLSAIVVSSLVDFIRYRDSYLYTAIGASGAVSAVVLHTILFTPNSNIYFIFLPIPIPAWLFGLSYLVLSYYLDKKGNDNIGHMAHLSGGVWGLFFPWIIFGKAIYINFIKQLLN